MGIGRTTCRYRMTTTRTAMQGSDRPTAREQWADNKMWTSRRSTLEVYAKKCRSGKNKENEEVNQAQKTMIKRANGRKKNKTK